MALASCRENSSRRDGLPIGGQRLVAVVDQDVDRAGHAHGLLEAGGQQLGLHVIERDAVMPGSARLRQRFRKRAGPRRVATGDDHRGAGFGQSPAHGRAQVPAAAGHQRHAAGQVEQLLDGRFGMWSRLGSSALHPATGWERAISDCAARTRTSSASSFNSTTSCG